MPPLPGTEPQPRKEAALPATPGWMTDGWMNPPKYVRFGKVYGPVASYNMIMGLLTTNQ